MTGICCQCGRFESLHLMTNRRNLHLDRRKGVGRKYLYCTVCQAAWLAHEERGAVREETPRVAWRAAREGAMDALTKDEREAIGVAEHDCNCAVCDDLVVRYEATLAAAEAERDQARAVLVALEQWIHGHLTADPNVWDRADNALAHAYAAWRAARE